MTWREPVTRAALLLMEAMWTYAAIAFVVALITEGGKPSFVAVVLVVGISYAISRFFQSSELSLGVVRLWGTLLSFLIFYMIVRVDYFGDWRFWDFDWANDLFYRAEATLRDRGPVVVGVPLLWVAWLRGLLRGQQPLGWDNVVATFGVGVLIMGTVLVFHGGTDAPRLVGQLAIPYVAIGLIAMALAHAARAEDEAGKPFSTTWLTAIGGSIVALAVVAAVLSLFDLGTVTAGLRSALDVLVDAGGTVLYYLAIPVGIVFEGLFIAIRWLVYLILGEPNPQPRQTMSELEQCILSLRGAGLSLEEARQRCTGEAPDPRELPAWLGLASRVFVAGLVVLALALLTAFMFSRFRKREQPGELKESVYQEGRLAADLAGLLNTLLGRIRPNIRLGREHQDAVRRLYFEMLDEAEHRGIERKPHQTPLELAPTLDRQFEAFTPRRITDAFDDVRYGGHRLRDEEVRRLREEWDDLKQRPS